MKKWKLLLYFSVAAIGITCPILAEAEVVATNKATKNSQEALWELDDNGVLTFENGVIPKKNSKNPWEEQTGIKEIIINEHVAAPEDSSRLFQGFSNLKQLDKLDVSNVTNMSGMFSDATIGAVNELDLNSWDTSNVTDMSELFAFSKLKDEAETGKVALHIENWDTSNVTNMILMFAESDAGSLDLSSWDTSNVTEMESMFFLYNYFSDIPDVELDLSNWQTSQLTDIAFMFDQAHITSLNVDGWDTTNVKYMSNAFSETYLTELDLSSWSTPRVLEIVDLFAGNLRLKILDISGFNTSKVEPTGGYGIFRGAENLEQITLGPKSVFNHLESNLVEIGAPYYWEGKRTKVFYNSGEEFMQTYDGSQPDTYVRVNEQSSAENLADAEITLLKNPGVLCFVDVETEAQIRFADVTLNGREQEVSEKSGTQSKISVLDTRSDKSKGWDVTVNYQDNNFYDFGLSMSLTPSATLGNTQTVTLAKSAQVFFSRGTATHEEKFQALLTPKLTISSLMAQTGEIRTGLNWTLVPEV